MSIQTQIDRISGNISSALTAIADKGVTVPDGSTSDALAELIASIEAGGGGLPEGIAAMTSGTYIPGSDVSSCTIEHGLGAIPDFFILNSTGSIPYLYFNTTLIITAAVHHDSVKNGYVLSLSGGNYGDAFNYNCAAMSSSSITSSSIKLNATAYSSKAVFASGRNYTWYAGVYAS